MRRAVTPGFTRVWLTLRGRTGGEDPRVRVWAPVVLREAGPSAADSADARARPGAGPRFEVEDAGLRLVFGPDPPAPEVGRVLRGSLGRFMGLRGATCEATV